MPKTVDRHEVQKRLDEGAQLVDVLPGEQYEEQHLPGAVSIPLKELGEKALEKLDPEIPVMGLLLGLSVRPEPSGRVAA